VSPTAFIPLFTSCFNSLARSFTCSSKPAMVPPAHRKGEWMDQFSPFHYFNRGPSSIQWWVRAMMYRCDDHDSHDSWTSKKTAAIALDIRREQGVKPRSLQFKNPREIHLRRSWLRRRAEGTAIEDLRDLLYLLPDPGQWDSPAVAEEGRIRK
ncbi:hypothetical protein BHE74_00047608, partial [Ensete ventricosum]